MNVWVTGGTGFIGKPLLKKLVGDGHRVYALARSIARYDHVVEELGLQGKRDRMKPIIGDLTKLGFGISEEDVESLLDADVFVHAGGPMDIGLGQAEAEAVFLTASREAAGLSESLSLKGRLRHFIHVVGYMSPYDEGNAFTDQSAAMRHAPPYERMKFAADSYIRKEMKRQGIILSVVNPSVVIGRSDTGETEQIGGLSILADAVRKRMMPLSPGGSDHWLPMVHVDHAAAFIALLAGKPPAASDTYYLMDRKSDSPSMKELVAGMARELRVAPPFASASPAAMKRMLEWGASRLLGIPAESMNFIVRKDFPLESKERALPLGGGRSTIDGVAFRRVIADLDYRLSHPDKPQASDAKVRAEAGLTMLELNGAAQGDRIGPDQPVQPRTPLILVHGLYSGAEMLLPLARAIRHDGPKLAVELPGFGRAPYHHHPSSAIEGYVDALSRLLESLSSPAIVIGHSFGGLIAARAMERAPERVSRLLLLQPTLHPVRAFPYRYPKLAASLFRSASPRMLAAQLENSGTVARGDGMPENYIRYLRQELASPRVLASTSAVSKELMRRESFRLQPAGWEPGKASILWGQLDAVWRLPPEYDALLPAYFPYGHQYPLSQPGLTAAWIEDMLSLRLS